MGQWGTPPPQQQGAQLLPTRLAAGRHGELIGWPGFRFLLEGVTQAACATESQSSVAVWQVAVEPEQEC